MTLPSLPDWLPWWVPILVLIPLSLWGLAMLVLPFSVIGLKPRLEGIEARLDDIQADIRALVLRLPESSAERVSYVATGVDQGYVLPERARPPIPPINAPPPAGGFVPRRPRAPDASPRLDEEPPDSLRARDGGREEPRAPSPRSEPRFDWRR